MLRDRRRHTVATATDPRRPALVQPMISLESDRDHGQNKAVSVKNVHRLDAVAKPAPATQPPSAPPQIPWPEVAAAGDPAPQTLARLIRVEHGLHVLSVGPTAGPQDVLEGIALPAIQITSPPSNRFDPVEIMTAWNDTGAWLGRNGGVVVLRSPPGGGNLLITAYTEPGAPPAFPDDIEVRPIDRPSQPAPRRGPRPGPTAASGRMQTPLRLRLRWSPQRTHARPTFGSHCTLRARATAASRLAAGSGISAGASRSRRSASHPAASSRRRTSNTRRSAPKAARPNGLPTESCAAPADVGCR